MWYRAVATSIANWAEEQGGIPLFTIEGDCAWQLSPNTLFLVCCLHHCNSFNAVMSTGEEPDSPTASWNLPALSKHASTVNTLAAESLSDDRARSISEGWKQYAASCSCSLSHATANQ